MLSTRRCAGAIGELYPHLHDIELVNFKVRILDETKGADAITRVLIDASDGQRAVGLDRGLGEPDRSFLGRARGLAGGRHAARRHGACPRGGRVLAADWRRGGVSAGDTREHETIPLARPVLGEAEEQAVLEVLRSGQLSLGPRLAEFERALRCPRGCAARLAR